MKECVWNVEFLSGVWSSYESLNDCDDITRTEYAVGPPLVNPPNPK